jgi:light-regulated signal transduction histidine kinase (bacteriophytochrome)
MELELSATKEFLALLNVGLSPYDRIYSLFPRWARAMRCDGVLLVIDGKKYGFGPVGENIDRIVQWVNNQDKTIASYCTDHVAQDLGLESVDDTCCGFLFVRLQDSSDSGIYFFRNEHIKNVLWAGQPKKIDDSGILTPRSSFLQYREVMRKRSKKWSNLLLEHAIQIQNAVTKYLLRWKAEKHRMDAERKKEEAERLQRENEVTRQSAIIQNNFLATVSHELRTPIHSILGNVEKLIEIHAADPDSQQACGMIRNSGEHLLALITDILDLSKLESNRMEISPITFDLYQRGEAY